MKNKKVHLIDPWDMRILKEYGSIETALSDTKNNSSSSVYLGVEGTNRAYLLDEFRDKYQNKVKNWKRY